MEFAVERAGDGSSGNGRAEVDAFGQTVQVERRRCAGQADGSLKLDASLEDVGGQVLYRQFLGAGEHVGFNVGNHVLLLDRQARQTY